MRILNVELLVYIHVTAVFSTHVKNRPCMVSLHMVVTSILFFYFYEHEV